MKSGLQSVTRGAPQGSIFAPNCFLCILMIFAMYGMYQYIIPYADDTNVLYKHENIYMCIIVSVELDKLNTWLALNKLALNISKTHFLFFLIVNQ